ncbi:hypothetical protein RHMOL_Rhmol03G0212300 [Rhododendron molle]|uniref:Uncharacterized protein n=1 Tax=Rhododendron molle TaxID=49168 RepID=A0ACC0PJB6_RHOML|nr:hypothetical protein RHMOL_Rhmol03G0212300 [Rhododendron molle]
MEESLPARSKEETMSPLNTAPDPIPQPNPVPPRNNDSNSSSKKRKQCDADIHNSAYFKILHIVQQLRPQFIEALQAPDFRNCKPSYEIRKRMKLVMDLYRHMQIEGNPIEDYESKSGSQILPGGKKLEKEHGLIQLNSILKKLPEKELPPDPLRSGEKYNDGRPKGSYIVGGSVSSKNFITFAHRNPPVYYGVTKESYRLSHSKSDER